MFIIYAPVAAESLPKAKKIYLYFGAKGKAQRTLEVLAAKKTNYVTAGAWETR